MHFWLFIRRARGPGRPFEAGAALDTEQEQALSELQDTRGAAGEAIASVVGELTSARRALQPQCAPALSG
jgi:hypothetical protein